MNTSNSGENKELIEQAFVGLQALQGIQSGGGTKVILLADIVSFIRGAETRREEIETALKSDLRVRRQFNAVLNQLSVSQTYQEAMAQDQEEIEQRQGEGFRLKFRATRANDTQLYVILEIDPSLAIEDGHRCAIVGFVNGNLINVAFPPLNEGRSQAMMLKTDERLTSLRDPNIAFNLVVSPPETDK